MEEKIDRPKAAFLQHKFKHKNYEEWKNVRPLWKNMTEQQKEQYAPFGTFKGQKIEGPPALHQIWPYNSPSVGVEWKEPPPSHQPLTSDQIKSCKSEFIKSVSFKNYLGEGRFGTVWEAEADYRSNELLLQWRRFIFAVKVIRHAQISYTAMTTSLKDVLVLQYLRHENICNMADCVGIPDSKTEFPYSVVCIFLEYCHGNFSQIYLESKPNQNLEEQQWTLPENLSRHWFAQIIRGLEYLHSNNVIHYDIKMVNILFRYTNDPVPHLYEDRFLSATFKIADFGLSEWHTTLPQNFEELRQEDVNAVFTILFTTAIGNQNLIDDFINYYISEEWENHYPESWNYLSQDIKELICDMHVEVKSAAQILNSTWLQNNNEPRTEFFILRPDFDIFSPINLQPNLYQDWTKQQDDPKLHINFAPFGVWTERHRKWDPETQTWILSVHYIHGPVSEPDLIEHGLWEDI